jgi:CHAT domain-containing protein
MKVRPTMWLLFLPLLAASVVLLLQGKANAERPKVQAAASALTDEDKKNIQEYVELLREDLRQEKAEILAAVLQLNAAQAAKFWPIYKDYETELTKINDRRVENIKSYAREYSQMTDEKADQLTKETLDSQRMRTELLAKYYERIKRELGATTAARFLRIENQLLSILDLQIDSKLPISKG